MGAKLERTVQFRSNPCIAYIFGGRARHADTLEMVEIIAIIAEHVILFVVLSTHLPIMPVGCIIEIFAINAIGTDLAAAVSALLARSVQAAIAERALFGRLRGGLRLRLSAARAESRQHHHELLLNRTKNAISTSANKRAD